MNENQISLLIYSLIYILLIALSFLFSMCDMAYGSVNVNHIKVNYEKNKKKSLKISLKLLDNFDQTLSTIILSNDLVNIALEIISIPFSFSLLKVIGIDSTSSLFTIVTLVISIATLVILILFGDILPKSIGKIQNYKVVTSSSIFIFILYYALFPFTFLTKHFINGLTYPIRKNVKDVEITDDELHEMVDDIEENGVVDEEKADMLRGTIDYANTLAYEIMTPRVDVYALDINSDLDEILSNEDTFLHSRIPVYEGSIDNIVGFVLSKTLIRMKIEGIRNDIRSIILPILNFPRSIEINDIFKEFKRTKTHLAVILDEYGGTEGIITLEDILEEIVGEIWDETDDKENPIIEQKDGTYIVDGKMNLDDFFTEFNLDKEDLLSTEYVTIGGFCIELSDNEFCKVNDVIKYKNLTLKVLAVDNKNTIEKLYVTVSKDSED